MLFLEDLFGLLNFVKPSGEGELSNDAGVVDSNVDEFGKTSVDYAT